MLRDMRFIYGPWLVALVAFLQLLQGCDEDPVGELLASDGTDAANAGVFEVTRRPDGTIEIGIYGLKGVSQYQIFEFETDDVTGEMKETRQLRTLRHIPGQLEYRLETFDIPFGKNFCYQAKVEMAADNKVKDLGVIGCLQDNSAWYFKGIQKAQVDAAGRVVLSWDRIPSDGVTYEVFSKIGDGVKMSDRPMARITDAADYIDEVGENVFPRCYLVRANHQRCSAKDANEFSLCIDQSTYQAEMLSSPDAERPVFAGLKSISVSKSQTGLVNGVLAALGLSNSYSIQLTWDPASDNLTRIGRMVYHVYRVRTGSRGELNYSKPLAVTDSGALSYTDSSIEERVSYEYLVRAVDERGNMDVNEVWKEIPLDFEPPVFDGAVSAISERQSNSVQVRVSWARAFDNKTDPINIEYRIYRRPKGEPQFDLSAPLATRTGVASESISYVDTSVVRGGTYQYLVRAVDKDGNEDTNEAVVEVVASGLAPAFSGLKSVTRYGRNVDLRWAGATDDDSSQAEITYTVYRSEDELFGPSKVLGVTEPGATYFVDTSSDVDTTYNYLVRATDRNGFEDENNEVKVLAANRPPEWAQGTNRTGPGPEWRGLKNNLLVWDKTEKGALLRIAQSSLSDDYTEKRSQIKFRVFRSTTKTGFDFTRHVLERSGSDQEGDLTFIDTSGHDLGSGYYYAVVAIDEFGARSLPSTVVQLPANESPSAPQNVSVRRDTSSGTVEVAWNPAEDDRSLPQGIRYEIETKAVDGSRERIQPTLNGATSYNDAFGAAENVVFEWRVRAVESTGDAESGVGKSEWSDAVRLAENTPPRGGGILSATRESSDRARIDWSTAADAEQERLNYLIYYKAAPQDVQVSQEGVVLDDLVINDLFDDASNAKIDVTDPSTSTYVLGLDPARSYLFGVRAFDALGLNDGNRRVLLLPGNKAPVFGGLVSAALAPGTNRAVLNWTRASDDQPSAQIEYRVYIMSSSNPSETGQAVLDNHTDKESTERDATSAQFEVANTALYTHYLVRAVDLLGAEDANMVVRTIAPDLTPPSFAGIKNSQMSARPANDPDPQFISKITFFWDPASDSRTVRDDIVYWLYESTSPDPVDILSTLPVKSNIMGSETQYQHTPPSAHTYYYILKAVDKAGNRDSNRVVARTVDEDPPDILEFGLHDDGLKAAYAVTNASVQVFWVGEPQYDVDQYRIYLQQDTINPIAAVKVIDPSGDWINSYTITGLETATEYTLLARAVDAAGNEEKNTNAMTVTTLASLEPPVFAGLQDAAVAPGVDGLTQVDLTWSAASGATHYRIFRALGTSALGTEFDFSYESCQGKWGSPAQPGCVQIDAEGVTSYRVQGLSKASTYSFVVRAVRLSSEGFVIDEEQNRRIRSVTTLTERAPTFVGAASTVPASGDAGLSSIVVKWDAPSSDGVWDGFTVLYKDLSSYPGSQTSFPVPDNFSTDAGLMTYPVSDVAAGEAVIGSLEYGHRYCFTVVTRYQPMPSLRSVPANPGGYRCTTPTAQPPEFVGVKGEVTKGIGAQAFKQFTVQWDPAVGSFSRYEISWSTDDDYVSAQDTGSFFVSAFTTAKVTSRTQTSYTITGLDPNVTYYVRVRAVFEIQDKNVFLASGSDALTQNTTSPVIPNGDGVLSVQQISDEEVEIRWDAPNNGGLYDRYYLFRTSGSGADATVIAQTDPNFGNVPPYQASPFVTIPSTSATFQTRTYVNTGVLPNTRYCYVVKAAYGGLEGFVGSPNTKVACVDVEISPPEFNGIVSLQAPNSPSGFNSLVAQWEPAVGNFTKYQYAVLTAPSDAPVWMDINGGRDTTTTTIVGLNPNTVYYVRVRAVYSKLGTNYTDGESVQLQSITTPLAPQHAGLEPVVFLTNPGEVEISWDLPDADPNIGGVYDRFLVWRYTNGSATDIMNEIEALTSPEFDSISPGVISSAEISSGVYRVTEIANPAATKITYTGDTKLVENIQTCFLVRAAFRNGSNFLMSSNQTVRCVTPTASAPLFGGIKTLENIPNTVNGFTSLKATWNPAQGNFTRYEIALGTVPGSTSWTPRAAALSDINESFRLLYNRDGDVGAPATALQAHTTYYGRMRAVYEGTDGSRYTSGESAEIARTVLPNRPTGDGILSANATKVPGEAASAALVLKGNVPGFWDKVFIWREVHDDQGTAYNAVIARAAATADGKAFASAPNITVLRPSSVSTNNINYSDVGIAVGKYSCYIARAGYNTSPNFLLSTTPQTPVCVRPQYVPISFAGVSTSGSEVCAVQVEGENSVCNPDERWPYTGNSKIRLRLEAAPAGDIDMFDVYMGTTPDAATLLSKPPFQSILKGDPDHDPDPGDVFLHVGGDHRLHIPPGKLYFLVRARCLGCAFVDTNSNVSNAVEARVPYTVARFNLVKDAGNLPISSSSSSYGAFEDQGNMGALGSSGFAELVGPNDFLTATNPVDFAPKPGRTFGIKFEYLPGTNSQNVEGSAVFAADVGNRQPFWRDTGVGYHILDGSHLGVPGASAVYDRRSKKCLFIGGYAGNGINRSDWPYRDWTHIWQVNNRWNALRFQGWDGQNFGEIRTRGPSPLPRSMPVTGYNPNTGNVMLFGGWDQGAPQRLRADTWEWDGASWQLVSEGPPDNQVLPNQPGRYGDGVMAFDPFRQQMVMVGGRWKIPAIANPNADASRVTTTGAAAHDNLQVLRDVRKSSMWHFFPDGSGEMNWQATIPLPSEFPDGYPAALVSVPVSAGASIAGLYYLSTSWTHWEWAGSTSNIWHWNGDNWVELIDSKLPARTPWAQIFADWDPVKKKIVLTFGRGNEELEQVVYEWDPALAQLGPSAWTQHQLASAPVVRFGQSACYDVDRREFVIAGGTAHPSANNSQSKSPGTYQDLYTFSTQTLAWKRINLRYDHSSQGMYQRHETLKGVHATNVEWAPGLWGESSSAHTNWLFKNGFWNQIVLNAAKKFSWSRSGVSYSTNAKMDALVSAPGEGQTYRIWQSDVWASTSNGDPVTGYGRPEAVQTFDGTGWTSKPVVSTTHMFPSRICLDPAVTSWAYHPYSYPNFSYEWESVFTPWGLLSATVDVAAVWPYNFYQMTNPVCSAGQWWRYARSPFIMLVDNGEEGYNAMEVLETSNPRWGSVAAHANGRKYQFCQPPSNQVHSVYLDNLPYMQFDAQSGKVWLFGVRERWDWSRFESQIQAISYHEANQCFLVENYTASFEGTSFTRVSSYNWGLDYWGYDPVRNVISVFGKHGVSSTALDGGTVGVIWELDLDTRVWRQRFLPVEFRKWTALQGNRLRVAAIPGKTGEYLVQGVIERHSNRALSEGYIITLTDDEVKMRPILPRFGLTIGDDGVSAYLSVPGDLGEQDVMHGGEQLYTGKRLITPNLVGENDLWIVFKTTTYDVYLNGALVVSNQTWAGAQSSLYMMDFLLGARYGSYYYHDDAAQSNWKGVGNTNIRVDWVKVFDRQLTRPEQEFWEVTDDNEPLAP